MRFVWFAAAALPSAGALFVSPLLRVSHVSASTARTTMNIFNGFNGGARERINEEEAWEAQQDVLRRRRNKNEMNKYMQKVEEGRQKANEKVEMWSWQRSGKKDTLEDWQAMKKAGKIKPLYDPDENQEGGIPIPSASFGVGGQFGVGGKWDEGGRFDLRLPYVDQGYVDESADLMGKLFGRKQKKPAAASAPSKAAGKPAKATPTKAKAAAPPAAAAPAKEAKKGWFW